MNAFVGSMALLVSSIVLYQVAQRLLPKGLDPWHALIVVYALALALSVAASLLSGSRPFAESLRAMGWSVPLIGLAVVGIELGWVLALRAGWPLATTGLVSQAAVAGLVVPVGLLVFRERLSAANLVGLVLCLAGLALVARR